MIYVIGINEVEVLTSYHNYGFFLPKGQAWKNIEFKHVKDTQMAKAIWNGTILAESDDYKIVEGNVYFPPESVKNEYLSDSGKDYECSWKGHADYYNIIVGDKVNVDAAWSYPDPKPAAKQIKEHLAFERGKGVSIEM